MCPDLSCHKQQVFCVVACQRSTTCHIMMCMICVMPAHTPCCAQAELELLKYRRVTEDLLAEHLKFHVRGVSFNQEAASAVEPLQPLLFMREPGNPHDPNAVSVQTLSGQTVGYVPKEEAAENFVGHDKRGKPYGIMAGVYRACLPIHALPWLLMVITPSSVDATLASPDSVIVH